MAMAVTRPASSLGERWRRWIRLQYLRLVRLNDTPDKIGWGVALGVFLGILPTFGVGLVMAYFLAAYLRVNRAAALAGALIMNPWTTPFFWTLSYVTGALILGLDWKRMVQTLKDFNGGEISFGALVGQSVLLPYLLGNLVLSLTFALASYGVARISVQVYQNAKARRLAHLQRLRKGSGLAPRAPLANSKEQDPSLRPGP